MTPGESLAPWLLPLEQESARFYTKKVRKKILQNYIPISTQTIKFVLLILKSRIQETLDTIIGEHQSEAIKNRIILHSFYYL